VIDEAGRQIILERNGQAPYQQLGALINTPWAIRNEMETVNRLVDSLGVTVNASPKLSKSLVRQFSDFWNEWKAFYANNQSLTARFFEGSYDQTLAYRDRAMQWQARLKKAGADVTPDQIVPPSSGSKTLTYIGIGAVVLVGLFIAGKLVHTIMLGDGELQGAKKSRSDRSWTLRAAERAAIAIMARRRIKQPGRRS